MIDNKTLKLANELIQTAKNMRTSWEIEVVSIKEHRRVEAEQAADTDPNNIKVVIYVG